MGQQEIVKGDQDEEMESNAAKRRAFTQYGHSRFESIANGDDVITIEELLSHHGVKEGTKEHVELTRQHSQMDADGDGRVSGDEYSAWQKKQEMEASAMGQISVDLTSPNSKATSELTMLKKKKFQIDFKFDELSLTLKSIPRKVLSGVTGSIVAGHVTAVMGPSGAGKTTFLSTLSGKAYYGTTDGTVKINGAISSISDYKKVVGFVPQEDTMQLTY